MTTKAETTWTFELPEADGELLHVQLPKGSDAKNLDDWLKTDVIKHAGLFAVYEGSRNKIGDLVIKPQHIQKAVKNHERFIKAVEESR